MAKVLTILLLAGLFGIVFWAIASSIKLILDRMEAKTEREIRELHDDYERRKKEHENRGE